MSCLTQYRSSRAKIESSIICSNVRIGEKAQIQASEIGNGYEIEPDSRSLSLLANALALIQIYVVIQALSKLRGCCRATMLDWPCTNGPKGKIDTVS
jgi:NDP-sugar pyrophosphorylase family protein